MNKGCVMRAIGLGVVCLMAACAEPGGEDGLDGVDGADGQDGTDGDDGDPGLDCWDLNENGEADPEEDLNDDGVVDVADCSGQVEKTPFIGTLEIWDELGAMEFCRRHDKVYGKLTIKSYDAPDLSALSCLVEVSHDLTFETALEVSLPNLLRLGGTSTVRAAGDVDFSALEEMASLTLYVSHEIPGSLDLSSLHTASGSLVLRDGVESVSAPLVPSLGALWVDGTDIESLDGLAALETLENLRVTGNLSMEEMDGLRSLVVINMNAHISNNRPMTDAHVLDVLSEVTVLGSVQVDSNGP